MPITYPDSIRDPILLRQYYINQRLNSNEIGEILGVDGRLVRTWLKLFNIPSLGYSCLILWESEIKTQSEEELIATIRQFAKGRLESVPIRP